MTGRPLVVDCFPFLNEFDILQCRLEELYEAVDYFVLVEADTNHQGAPKPYHYLDNAARFAPWADKIIPVQAKDLPPRDRFEDHWTREVAQREWIGEGLDVIGVRPHDIILQSDVDEIPRALHARNVRPQGVLAFGQRLHCFAVDWLHPMVWKGTVASTAGFLEGLGARRFGVMRDMRNTAPCPPYLADAGWHMSWLGGVDAGRRKLTTFCHTEISEQVTAGLDEDVYYRKGWHVDGTQMRAVDVDESWPAFVYERRCPENWFRPR